MPNNDKVDIAAFLQRPLAALVATRDAQLRPTCVSGSGLCLLDHDRAVVYIPEYEPERALVNLRETGAIAVVVDQPTTHLGLQLKGRVVELRPTRADELEPLRRFVAGTLREYEAVGVSPAVRERLVFEPCVAVEFEITDVFEQTPGPGAGRAVGVTR